MVVDALLGGLDSFKDYIALHVLTCLIPAFLLAGGVVTFVCRETIIGYLGAAASKALKDNEVFALDKERLSKAERVGPKRAASL